ncbi:MAG: LemA family protein [Proteiniphilum sp.]|nr:LemA family protein [Proteiniphilum sp.]
MKNFKYILLLIITASLTLTSCGYNTMVNKQETVNSQWANVENAYQRRADLIPNLVSTVKGYASHEQETLTQVVEARAKATQTTVDVSSLSEESIKEFQDRQGELSTALGRLMMIQENYPELKANQNFLALQDELSGTENRISVERNKFNQVAQDFNTYIKQFPRVIYAGWFGFKSKGYFQSAPGSETAPKVEF